MKVYSQEINFFRKQLKSDLDAMAKSLGFNTHYVPVVIFTHKSKLGYFKTSPRLEIGINEKLMSGPYFAAKETVFHELAHYMVYRRFGQNQGHNENFRAACKEIGICDKAKEPLSTIFDRAESLSTEKDKVVDKVKKLLALSSSDNENESELALLKANALLRKNGISNMDLSEDSKIYKLELKEVQSNAKYKAIDSILSTFGVYVLWNGTRPRWSILEVSGELSSIKVAEYVFEFLDKELDHMWSKAKKDHNLKGARAKNSFFRGVAQGYRLKLKAAEASEGADGTAIQKYDKDMARICRSIVYDNKTKVTRSNALTSPEGQSAGVSAGKSLSIRQGVSTGGSVKMIA